MRDRLLWRLLAAQLLVILIAVAISGSLIYDIASHAFMAIMMRYHIEPSAVEAEFLHATLRALLLAGVSAAAAAMLLGWVLVRRLVRPLDQMMVLAERIASGDYGSRVDVRGPDEVARLAEAFNRMAAGLQRIERLRRDLVADVAHELRTPLSTLRGYLEAFRDGVAPASPETLASLHEEVLRLVRLVDALHQLSQFDARVFRPHPAPVDVPALVHRMVTVRDPELRARRMAVRETHGPDLPPIVADADLVSQALWNLLDNAIRYAPEGAEVAVSSARAGGAVRILVENTGEEIPARDLPRIFERFYRGDKSRSRETGGAGIGLALVQEIARAHGGEVGAWSAHGRTGVWFTLTRGSAPEGEPSARAAGLDRGGSPSPTGG